MVTVYLRSMSSSDKHFRPSDIHYNDALQVHNDGTHKKYTYIYRAEEDESQRIHIVECQVQREYFYEI